MEQLSPQWRGLSPWSIVSFTFHTIRVLVTNGYAMLPFIYTGWKQGFDSIWMLIAFVGSCLLIFTSAIIDWAMFRYRLFDDKLGIRQGLIFKKAHEIPLSKIQNIRLEQPLYFRPMGLYSLVVETAGSKKDEAELAAVSYRQAIELKQRLVNPSSLAGSEAAPEAELPQCPTPGHIGTDTKQPNNRGPLVLKKMKSLLLFGFYQNNLFWFAIIAGPIIGQFDWEALANTELALTAMHWYEQNINVSISLQLFFALAMLIGFYLLLSLISMAAAVLKYYPYQLSLHGDTLHRTGGIIAKQNDALTQHRIQVIRFTQPIIGRLLKLWTINFKQVKGTEVEQAAKKHMLVPSMTREGIAELMPELPGLASVSSTLPRDYRKIHSGWFWRRGFLPLLIPMVNTLFIGLNPFTELLWFAALCFVFGLYLRYRQWGYQHQGDDCWIHTGMLGQTWHLIPLKKVQHVAMTQTASQKRKQLASLELGLASGKQTIPYMPLNDARAIAERALAITARDHTNWI
ncbi:PH domain-containing protein [uncultured Shewanella sp.]|uniref:PH domain-containing protein n=1 Tax=Shewanella atlantica TaxID=271099 RepID=UPI00261BCF7F|nr:PH domain-containing protein [uncultured Shewanella sp.]